MEVWSSKKWRIFLAACGSFSIALFALALSPQVTAPSAIETCNDQKFIIWAQSSAKVLNSDVEGILNAAANYDLKAMNIAGWNLKEDSRLYTNELNEFDVSPELKPAAEELENALKSFRLAGKYIELGTAEAVNLATDYTLEGNAHITLMNLRLPENSQKC